MEAPTGVQWEIRHGGQRAVVVEVGAGLREYEIDGQPILDGYARDQMPDGGRGQPLLPWPNRLADGQYEFGGQRLQLPIDEVSRRNASHGLTRWLNWDLADQTPSSVTLSHVVHPRTGYPFALRLAITYSLGQDGLTVHTRASNAGERPLPFGAGQHPYFSVGTPTVDAALLRVPAEARLELEDERRLPTGHLLPTLGTDQDFRMARPIGTLVLDDCFTDFERDTDGRFGVTLASPDGKRRLSVWMDEHYRYVQVFTGDTLAPARRRQGIAIEPMTCPPNAFQSGTDLMVIEPGASVNLEWGVRF